MQGAKKHTVGSGLSWGRRVLGPSQGQVQRRHWENVGSWGLALHSI